MRNDADPMIYQKDVQKKTENILEGNTNKSKWGMRYEREIKNEVVQK